ncbi:MAG: polynucleotide adenylyltransferase PcnB [Myxococcales bacterium]|nr:polynucleotide adenylyltransferase PcnB [Myxococcales bacterium]
MTRQLSPITSDRIDAEAAKVVRRLTRYDYEAYLVGGCVRDLLLGRSPKDFDVSTNATPTEIRKLFRNSRIIGRRFRLVHIFFGRKIIETATFRAPPPQSDDEDDDLLIWRDNVFGSAEEDALRRDFTINGLFYDLSAEQVIDTVGGLEDLRAGLVRTIGDPDIRFQEDPVRILRAIKFATRLDMTIEPETLRALVAHRGLIARCSVARVLEEIYRLLSSGTARVAFELMHRTGVLAVLFPELAALLPEPADKNARTPVEPLTRSRRDAPSKGSDWDDDDETSDDEESDGVGAGDDENGNSSTVERLLAHLELETPELRRAAGEALYAHLGALDEMMLVAEEPLTHAVVLGALVLPLLAHGFDPERRAGWLVERIDAVITAVATRIQVSRRDKERLRQILVAQRRMCVGRPRKQMVHRDYFREAYELLELRQHAGSAQEGALDRWVEHAEPRKRRQRTSRARGRRRRGARHSTGENR